MQAQWEPTPITRSVPQPNAEPIKQQMFRKERIDSAGRVTGFEMEWRDVDVSKP
jgi:hypothetical protein